MKVCLFSAALLACVASAIAHPSADDSINLNQSLVLTQQQRLAFEDEAARGSGEAALKVALFYGFVALNPVEERRWTQIGAENGDTACQYNLYHDLIESESSFDRARALFWLRKAASRDEGARKELGRLEHGNGM